MILRTLYFFLLAALTANFAMAQTARVQVIHNAPTPTVDVYAGSDLLLNDFAFRTATPFVDLPAGVSINVGIALGSSTSSADAIANFPVQFESGKTYIVVATGIVGGTPGFELKVFDLGRETANTSTNVGLLFYHGSPDAPGVDILTGGSGVFTDVTYGNFQGYVDVPANAVYQLDVTPANDNNTIVASYTADLSFWAGKTAVVFASGFLGGDQQPSFEPWVALSNGGTFPLKAVPGNPPGNSTSARVQVIHNSPTPTVDIYAGNDLLLNDFAFRTATPFVDLPAGVSINIGVALASSQSASDAIANFPVQFEAGKTYVVVATGIVGGTPGFELKVFDLGKETANDPANVGLLFYHGSPDAPGVDILTGGSAVFNDVTYGNFQGYVNVPANATYALDVTPANDNNTIVASYSANLSFWAGKTAVVFASGFLGANQTPAFEPWVALSNGGTFPLTKTGPGNPGPSTNARLQVIHNAIAPTVDVYVNGGLLLNDFAFRTATPFVDVPAGVSLDIAIAPANSASAADAVATFPGIVLTAGARYIAVASGILNGTPGFDLDVFAAAQETADASGNVGVQFYHGSPDAPVVDIVTGGSVLFNDVSFGNFGTSYLNVPANNVYQLDVTPGNDNSTIVASYDANLSFWGGRTALIFASGFLGGAQQPVFEPWVALSNGGTFPLSPASKPFKIVDSRFRLQGASGTEGVFPNPATDQVNINVELSEPTDLQIKIVDLKGRIIRNEPLGILPKGINTLSIEVAEFETGQYFLVLDSNNYRETTPFVISR